MSKVHDFTVGLARAGKGYKEKKEINEATYPGQSLSRSQIYLIIKQLNDGRDGEDKRGKEQARKVRKAGLIDTVRAEVEADRRVTITQLVQRCQVSRRTINLVLTLDLGLSKKSARLVPKTANSELARTRGIRLFH